MLTTYIYTKITSNIDIIILHMQISMDIKEAPIEDNAEKIVDLEPDE
jgi:hypothetical protein